MPRVDLKDMNGVRCGDRIVVAYAGSKKWRTRCRCGREFVADGADLRRRAYVCDHDPSERFWAKVDKSESCWVWTASKNEDGYGTFKFEGRAITAHIFSWQLAHGPVPAGRELDHLCRNRACVNPDHLEPVTHAVNVRRGDLGRVTRARFSRKAVG